MKNERMGIAWGVGGAGKNGWETTREKGLDGEDGCALGRIL